MRSTSPEPRPIIRRRPWAGIALLALGSALLVGCEAGLASIDKKTLALLEESTLDVHGDTEPAFQPDTFLPGKALPPTSPDPSDVSTINPRAAQLQYRPREEAQDLARRLEEIEPVGPGTVVLDLKGSIRYAIANSPEYKNAADSYMITALSLLIERHRWGPRFFNDTSLVADAVGDDGLFDSALTVVNDFSVTQRLPYGGAVSARLLASASEDLVQRVSDTSNQTAAAIIEADIPLLRGSGLAAREDLIQAERNVIYAARDFESFRRQFFFDIASDYLDLVVLSQNIENAQRQVEGFQRTETRELALVRAGRQEAFQAALAAQDVLFSRDRLAGQIEQYRLAIDRFKVRLGMPVEQRLDIVPEMLGLAAPKVETTQSVLTGLTLRLDLQTARDQVEDDKRGIDIARNNILPGLDVFGSANIATDPRIRRAGLQFSPGDSSFSGGVRFSAPLDREIEEAQLRQAQISYEQSLRDYVQFRDQIAVEIRTSARAIDRAIFSVRIQEDNVRVAELRQASIDAAPDRASARDRSDAVEALLQARDSLDQSRRDLQVAILAYLLTTAQLRVAPDGQLQPLPGMALAEPPAAPGS